MQKKIILAIILNVIVITASLGIMSYLAVRGSINRSLHNRLTLGGIIANYIEIVLQGNLNRLYDISLSGKVDLTDNDWKPERQVLETAYTYSLFTDGVFLLDKQGNKLLSYPPHNNRYENLTYIHYVNQVLREGRPVISNIYTVTPINKQVIFVLVPLRDKGGSIVGAAGGVLNPTNPSINQLLQTVKIEKNAYIEIIDSNEVVVASDNASRVLQHHDHGGSLGVMIKNREAGIRECEHGFSKPEAHGRMFEEKPEDVLTFTPLQVAPWGVIVGQDAKEVFAPSSHLRKKFMVLALIFVGTSILFAVGVSKSFVKPIKVLTAEAKRIARGDLSKPVGLLGSDETGDLSRSFDDMRVQLASSLESIKDYSVDLERRVFDRTREVRGKQEKIENLLKKLISSQEDERKRIARELHDETLQALSAMLMKIEICKLQPETVTPEKIGEMKQLVSMIIDETYSIIQNLRPFVLDDLGLDASIVWLLDKNLKEQEIEYFLKIDEIPIGKLSPEVEITIFRIIQEAVSNIARHSSAQNAFIRVNVEDRVISVAIEDDGEGFDLGPIFSDLETGRGLGILGMKERASLLNGNLEICSSPGAGTTLLLRIPIPRGTVHA